MGKNIDLSNQKFNRLTVIGQVGTKNGCRLWLCRCECGNIKTATTTKLKRGLVKSCGCLNDETRIRTHTTHGGTHTRLYGIWIAMRKRCYYKHSKDYHLYGAKGITVCESWKNSFENFKRWSLENGYRDDLTIDRIDGMKGYSPENCRWGDIFLQANNRNNNHNLMFRNETHSISEWARIVGICASTIHTRIRHGWSVERALTEKPFVGKSRTYRRAI